jgi:archaellum component FlaC
MSGDLHEISAEIGGLKKAVEMMTSQWQRQEETATAGRKALHDKVEMVRQELGIEVSGLGLRVDRLTDKVTLIEPSVVKLKEDVKEFEDEKLRDEGAKRLGKYLWLAMTAAAGVVGFGIHELIGYLKH